MNFFSKIVELFSTEKYMDIIFEGFKTTLIISVFAALLGLVLGVIVALVSISEDSPITKVLKAICKVYITVIRGTPMALQLFIMAYVIFAIRNFPLELTAIIAFGINSGAYVAENIRAGILSVDIGQTEAGRALGLSNKTTMAKIVIPQAVKNILPTMGNEFIALVKETSVVSFVGAKDLYLAFQSIGSGTYEYMVPYLAMAIIYIVIVCIITLLIKIMERRLRKSDRGR